MEASHISNIRSKNETFVASETEGNIPTFENENLEEINPNYSPSIKEKLMSKIFSKNRQECTFVSQLNADYIIYKFCNDRTFFKKKSDKSEIFMCPPVNFWNCLYYLPYGYELGLDQDGMIYFIDHINKKTTNILPTKMFDPDSSKFRRKESIGSDSQLELSIKLELPKKLKNLGWIIRNSENTVVVDEICPESPFAKKIIRGDIIESINGVAITREKDIQRLLKKNTTITCCIKRASTEFQHSFAVNNKTKSCLKSIERKEYLRKFPSRVHFSETPIIIKYKNQEDILWGSSNNQELSFDIIKINLPNGNFRTCRFERNQKIFEIVAHVLKLLKLSFNHCFTLALLHRGSTDIEYFSLNDLIYTLVLKKQGMDQTECFLVIFSHPQDPGDWADPKYMLLVDFLFQQFRLFLLAARFRTIFSIPKSLLHQLIALGTTVDFLNIRNRVDIPSNDPEEDELIVNSDESFPKNTSSCNINKNIRLSSFFLEQHKMSPPYSTIFDLRPDLSNSHIISFMISSFDLITPNDLKIFYLADKNVQKSFNITQEKIKDKIFVILQKAQICFVKACLECKIFPAARYRVVVRHNTKTPIYQDDTCVTPETLAITFNTLDFHREDENIYIMSLDDITGIVASSISDDHSAVTIFSASKNHLSIKLQSYYLSSLLLMLSARCNELWRDILKIKVPLFDLTNPEYRCQTNKIPEYDDFHLIIPSSWNYDNQCGNFFSTLKNTHGDQIEKFYDDFYLFFMLFKITTKKESQKIGINHPISISSCFHLKFKHEINKDILSNLPNTNSLVNEPEASPDEVDFLLSNLSKKVVAVEKKNSDILLIHEKKEEFLYE